MLVFEHIEALQKHLRPLKTLQSIGFAPTMGALHKGHASLIDRAKAENDIVVCSIFVNPTQFNDPQDLEKYPRTIEADKKILESSGCDILFFPSVNEIYPQKGQEARGEGQGKIDLGNLDFVMEASQRPGHFKGVVQVVRRLFDIVEPHKAYFGQKDFQQFAVIKEMVRQLKYKIEIVPCPIVREPDGLAMSSRNVRLTNDERKLAPLIFKTLKDVRCKMEDGRCNLDELKKTAFGQIASCNQMHLEYFEIVDEKTLLSVIDLSKSNEIVACIAVKLGQIRLIDNIILK